LLTTAETLPLHPDIARTLAGNQTRQAGRAFRKKRFDEWAVREVKNGAPLPGLYPPNAETKARYEAEIAQRTGL
jgi:hypothetical protein